MIAILALIISPVLGKTGGIKVDSDTVCEDPDKEDNTIGSSGTCFPTVWLNLPNGDLGSYTCQICDSGVCQACPFFSQFTSVTCGPDDNYKLGFFRTTAGTGSRTLVISDSEGKTVGRDSWRQVDGEDCPD